MKKAFVKRTLAIILVLIMSVPIFAIPASAASTPVFLDNYDKYILKKSFGYNDDNTCSAVAAGIAMNYIAAAHNIPVVPSNYVSETLNGTYIGGRSYVKNAYPNAYAQHRSLVGGFIDPKIDPLQSSHKMDAATHYPFLRPYVNAHIQHDTSDVYNLRLNQADKKDFVKTVKDSISYNKPLIIVTLGHKYYGYHTMCAYGYKSEGGTGADEKLTLYVHSGWYYDGDYNTDNTCTPDTGYVNSHTKQPTYTISLSDVNELYYFTFTNKNIFSGYTDRASFKYNNWYTDGVAYCIDKGIMSSNSSTEKCFDLNSKMTRAMTTQILYNVSGSTSTATNSGFIDVPANKWYAKSITWAVRNGITNGTSSIKFSPNDTVTREQFIVFLYRYAQIIDKKNYQFYGLSPASSYTDYNQVSSYAKDAMNWAVYKGILKSSSTTSKVLSPKDEITRAMAATIMMRYMRLGY